ncbi:MAG: DUF169 domain-containing protein [Bryobacterales bacterium]|nr:DUF169 domain-containing protein [Bryobacterales bacterium]MBV9398449.1 DUF169 domain-containing protein [Bryobacterales bacterium]
MTAPKTLAQKLTESLQLSLPPIAVSFADAVPEGVAAYSGSAPAGCRFWQEAATKVFATVPRDHELCAVGIYTHHLKGGAGFQTDLQDALKVFGDLGYVRESDLPFIPVLNREARVVVYGPLGANPLPPDVVLLFVKADQSLILSEASQQIENGLPPAMGRPACGVIPQAFNTGRTALSLGCCGARAYLDALTPDVALYAIPGSRLEEFADRVTALAKANGILTTFHKLRRRDVEAGARPSIKESLAAMQ